MKNQLVRLFTRPRFIRELAALGVVVMVVECLLTAFYPLLPSRDLERQRIARHLGITGFDTRSKSEVIADLRAHGKDAFPTFPVSFIRRPYVKQLIPEDVYPLANVADATIVECNESGQYLVFASDEHGFHNPKGLYQPGAVDIAAVGDSFTLGHCVPSEQNALAWVRQRYPRTLNFGMAGAGSLSMLATLKEFVAPLKPKVVLWMMYPLILDVGEELQDPILARYLSEPDFSQHLMERQAEVTAILRRAAPIAQTENDRREAARIEESTRQRWRGIVKLNQLRGRLFPPDSSQHEQTVDVQPFVRIIQTAKQTVEAWGGKFIFVYIPHYHEIVSKSLVAPFRAEGILPLVAAQNIQIIDGVAWFNQQPDPPALYNLRSHNHFNAAGHRLMGELLLRRLGEVLPAPSTPYPR